MRPLLLCVLLSVPPAVAQPPVVLPKVMTAEYGQLIDVPVKVIDGIKVTKWRVIPDDAQIRWYPDKRTCHFVARPETDTTYSIICSASHADEPFDAVCEVVCQGRQPAPPVPVVPKPPAPADPDAGFPYAKQLRAALEKDRKPEVDAPALAKEMSRIYFVAGERDGIRVKPAWANTAAAIDFVQQQYDLKVPRGVMVNLKEAINSVLVPVIEADSKNVSALCQTFDKVAKALERISGGAPPPIPPGPPAPGPSAARPLSEAGLRVFMVYESADAGMPAGVRTILTALDVRNAVRAAGGKLRLYDKDQEPKLDEPWAQEAHQRWDEAAKAGAKPPWLYVSGGGQAYGGSFPANVADMLTLLKKYGG